MENTLDIRTTAILLNACLNTIRATSSSAAPLLQRLCDFEAIPNFSKLPSFNRSRFPLAPAPKAGDLHKPIMLLHQLLRNKAQGHYQLFMASNNAFHHQLAATPFTNIPQQDLADYITRLEMIRPHIPQNNHDAIARALDTAEASALAFRNASQSNIKLSLLDGWNLLQDFQQLHTTWARALNESTDNNPAIPSPVSECLQVLPTALINSLNKISTLNLTLPTPGDAPPVELALSNYSRGTLTFAEMIPFLIASKGQINPATVPSSLIKIYTFMGNTTDFADNWQAIISHIDNALPASMAQETKSAIRNHNRFDVSPEELAPIREAIIACLPTLLFARNIEAAQGESEAATTTCLQIIATALQINIPAPTLPVARTPAECAVLCEALRDAIATSPITNQLESVNRFLLTRYGVSSPGITSSPSHAAKLRPCKMPLSTTERTELQTELRAYLKAVNRPREIYTLASALLTSLEQPLEPKCTVTR